MAGEKRPLVICAVCKLPILDHQRPSVTVGKAKEVHAECFNEWKQMQRKVN